MRTTTCINEAWRFVKHADSTASAWASQGEPVDLPHTWNAEDGQDGGNDYHRGTCWYCKKLLVPELKQGQQVYLEFMGAAMTAEVYVNGVKLLRHEGGYSTFRVNITDQLRDENRLVVAVENSDSNTVYPQRADFTFYGGLYRSVNLILVPESHFELDYCGTPGIKVTPAVNLETQRAIVTVETWQVKADAVTMKIDGQTKTVPSFDGYAKAEFIIENVHLWDGLDDPYLYTVRASLPDGDQISARFGCRSFLVDPHKGFFLNGRSYPLRGVSRHQDFKGVGNALAMAHHVQDMEIIKELGANTLRLAHYQHSQEFYDLCDENGLLVWAEIPYITQHMTTGRPNTLSQMEELVVQNYNHPSIMVWGLSNEISAASEVNEDLLENHRLLNELCHRLDSTRLTTMAHVFMLEIDSPLLAISDINSYNLYFGWYLGELEQNDSFFDEFHSKYPNRAIGFSEFGADANPQYQSSAPAKGDYSESYQALYHEHMAEMIEARPWLWATHVWNLFDFAADGRDEGGKHGENQKGLVTIDRKLKKDAFYLYKAYWSRTPFVHLCGRRYVDRAEDLTEVKVYSNLTEVSLYVDGKLVESKHGQRVFRFQVPITGSHQVEVRAKDCRDESTIRKATEVNQDYVFVKKNDVVNWFDQEDFNPDYFSVSDTLGDLRQNPQSGAIIAEIMRKATASRGDVAESVVNNPALQRMMNRLTLISLMKQAGNIEEESIKQLNRVLQSIKKEG